MTYTKLLDSFFSLRNILKSGINGNGQDFNRVGFKLGDVVWAFADYEDEDGTLVKYQPQQGILSTYPNENSQEVDGLIEEKHKAAIAKGKNNIGSFVPFKDEDGSPDWDSAIPVYKLMFAVDEDHLKSIQQFLK